MIEQGDFAAVIDYGRGPAIKLSDTQRQWIEELIKILKSHLSIESCSARSETAQRAHIHLCLLAFCRLEQERLRHGIATIYQELDLVDGLTVAENVAFRVRDPALADAWIARLGLDPHRDAMPGTLSGGEKQHGDVARARGCLAC